LNTAADPVVVKRKRLLQYYTIEINEVVVKADNVVVENISIKNSSRHRLQQPNQHPQQDQQQQQHRGMTKTNEQDSKHDDERRRQRGQGERPLSSSSWSSSTSTSTSTSSSFKYSKFVSDACCSQKNQRLKISYNS